MRQSQLQSLRALQAAQKESRADEQHGADGHLRDNQSVAESQPMEGGTAARVRVQIGDQVRSRGPQGRY